MKLEPSEKVSIWFLAPLILDKDKSIFHEEVIKVYPFAKHILRQHFLYVKKTISE